MTSWPTVGRSWRHDDAEDDDDDDDDDDDTDEDPGIGARDLLRPPV